MGNLYMNAEALSGNADQYLEHIKVIRLWGFSFNPTVDVYDLMCQWNLNHFFGS